MRNRVNGEEIVELFLQRLRGLSIHEWRMSLMLRGWSGFRDERAERALTASCIATLDQLRDRGLQSVFVRTQHRIYTLTATIDWPADNEIDDVDDEAEIMGAHAEWGALGLLVGEWLTPRQLVNLWLPWEAVTPIRSLSGDGVNRGAVAGPRTLGSDRC